jgi:hypothetical protein
MLISTAMMPITTNSSTSVNAGCRRGCGCFMLNALVPFDLLQTTVPADKAQNQAVLRNELKPVAPALQQLTA